MELRTVNDVRRFENVCILTVTLQYHNESVLKKYQERLKIGEVKEAAKL